MMLGYKKLMRCFRCCLRRLKDSNTLPLMHASIRRGMFLEIIGSDENQTELRDELFITGAFSLLDKITGAPFAHLFELISLSESIVDAIVRHNGPYAPYLTLIEAIERKRPDRDPQNRPMRWRFRSALATRRCSNRWHRPSCSTPISELREPPSASCGRASTFRKAFAP